jgi:ornithine cyclodeaminase/alanine dehydrogenase-like protein (mu-crystallin family)
MALFLTEDDVRALLRMERAIELVEASFRMQNDGQAMNRPRERILLPNASLHFMAAALSGENLLGMKIYAVTSQGMRFVVLVFNAQDGSLLAMIDADHLGRIRTGAASGVATKFLARENASEAGLIGAGRQARTQLEAVASVRKLRKARVFCRDENRRREFCCEMEAQLRVPIEPASSAEEAIRPADIVITATNSRDPVVRGQWLKPGTHINAIGSNMANRREMDGETLARAGVILADSVEQAKREAGDLIQGLREAGRNWEDVGEMHQTVAGARPGRRSDDEITIFKSCGIAIWDVVVAGYVYREAVRLGRGRKIEEGDP